jgi:hypothetical protein
MGGAVPPLPQYAVMAWCLVRVSTGTLPLPSYSVIVFRTAPYLFLRMVNCREYAVCMFECEIRDE